MQRRDQRAAVPAANRRERRSNLASVLPRLPSRPDARFRTAATVLSLGYLKTPVQIGVFNLARDRISYLKVALGAVFC